MLTYCLQTVQLRTRCQGSFQVEPLVHLTLEIHSKSWVVPWKPSEVPSQLVHLLLLQLLQFRPCVKMSVLSAEPQGEEALAVSDEPMTDSPGLQQTLVVPPSELRHFLELILPWYPSVRRLTLALSSAFPPFLVLIDFLGAMLIGFLEVVLRGFL